MNRIGLFLAQFYGIASHLQDVQSMSPLNLYSYELSRSSTSLAPWPSSVDRGPSHIDAPHMFRSTAHKRGGGKVKSEERPIAAEGTSDRVIRVRRLNSCVASIIGKAGTPFPTPRSGPTSPAYPPSPSPSPFEFDKERKERSLRTVLNLPSAAKDTQQSLSPRQLKPNLGELLICRC